MGFGLGSVTASSAVGKLWRYSRVPVRSLVKARYSWPPWALVRVRVRLRLRVGVGVSARVRVGVRALGLGLGLGLGPC